MNDLKVAIAFNKQVHEQATAERSNDLRVGRAVYNDQKRGFSKLYEASG